MTTWFDESRLDDERVLAGSDALLRSLAESGARVRRDRVQADAALDEAVALAATSDRPRAVVAAGPDSRLMRAVLEPWCPVPFVAWPNPGLPGWVGSLDLVVVLEPEGTDERAALAVSEALRRGAAVVVATPEESLVARHAQGRWCQLLPLVTRDQSAAAMVMLEFLDRVHLGPRTDVEDVARALDQVATLCSPHRDLSVNPAKALAIALADRAPVLWGGSVLAARAARRVAESLRRASGVSAIAGDAEHLVPVLGSAPVRDLFDDPVADDDSAVPPVLVVLDDGHDDPAVREQRDRLLRTAQERRVRVETLTCEPGAVSELARYASLMLQGRYAAAYLQIGLTGE